MLVEKGQLELISGCRAMRFPSHSLYADDVVIFFTKPSYLTLTPYWSSSKIMLTFQARKSILQNPSSMLVSFPTIDYRLLLTS